MNKAICFRRGVVSYNKILLPKAKTEQIGTEAVPTEDFFFLIIIKYHLSCFNLMHGIPLLLIY